MIFFFQIKIQKLTKPVPDFAPSRTLTFTLLQGVQLDMLDKQLEILLPNFDYILPEIIDWQLKKNLNFLQNHN